MKKIEAFAIIDEEYGFWIPKILITRKGNKLYPSCVFKDKEQAELCLSLKKSKESCKKHKIDIPKMRVAKIEIKEE